MSEEEKKKVWVVGRAIDPTALEASLNELAAVGYQIHSIHSYENHDTGPWFTVVAFDPMQLMAKQQAGMHEQLSSLMKGFTTG